MKKGAALLIVVLFIAIFGAVAVTMTRAGLLNGIFTNNTIDAIVAEEVGQSGLEVGLLHFKIFGSTLWPGNTMCIDVDNPVTEPPWVGCTNKSAKDRYADLIITKPAGNDLIKITSVGHYGYVIKKHWLTQVAEVWGP